METLVEEVFGRWWEGNNLALTYSEYEIDLNGFIYADAQEVPF